MDVTDVVPSYVKDATRFFRSPLFFIKEFDPKSREEKKTSIAYAVFALALTSALVLVELRLLPAEQPGLLPSVKKDELIFSYWVLILIFALLLHFACRQFRGQGTMSETLSGILRVYGFLVPASTLGLILLTQLIGVAVSTYWLVLPPLGISGNEAFAPTTTNLLLMAGLATVYFYIAVSYLLCTVWILAATHKLSYARTGLATVGSVVVLLLARPYVLQGTRKIYEIFEPLIGLGTG